MHRPSRIGCARAVREMAARRQRPPASRRICGAKVSFLSCRTNVSIHSSLSLQKQSRKWAFIHATAARSRWQPFVYSGFNREGGIPMQQSPTPTLALLVGVLRHVHCGDAAQGLGPLGQTGVSVQGPLSGLIGA